MTSRFAFPRIGRRLLCLLTALLLPTLLLLAQGSVFAETAQPVPAVDPVSQSDSFTAVLYNNTNGLPTSEANDIAQTGEGFIWIGSYSGLIRYDGKTFERMDSTNGLASVVRLYVDQKDRLWIGTNDSGVAMMERGELRQWRREDGLGSDKIRTITGDDAGRIYVGTTAGITLFDETLQPHPLTDPRIADVYMEKMLPGSDGIYVAPTEELLKNGEIKPVHYGIANGLPCIATSNSYSELTVAGDLYIAGSVGVAKVNIEASLENVSDLKQAVPFLDADGVRIYPDETGSFTLPSKVRKLTIYGFVFNYSLTDPQISYCLKGFDKEAVTVSRSELGPVSYTNLSGGSYDFFLIDDDHLGLVIADVSGKGIPAALFMTVSKAAVKNCAISGLSPAAALGSVNRQICANNPEDMFVTVWLGVLELSTGRLTAANAGHEYPALKAPDGGFELYKDPHGLVVGGIDDMIYREYELLLKPGTKLFVYTDGVPEATNRDNELFGSERMLAALNESGDAAPEALLRNVRRAVDAFVGDAEQFDDLTMLCLEYLGKDL